MTPDLSGDKTRTGRRFHWSVPAVVLSSLLLTALLFFLVRQTELASFRTRLESDVSQRTDAIINKIDGSVLVATALHNFFAASQPVTREEFSSFSRPFLQERDEIKALSWDPRISHPQRRHFEEQGCTGLDEAFFIYERDNKGDQLPAGNRNFYYPVCYIEPMDENRKAIGFDVGSDPVRLAALERARDTGSPMATERIMLVQEGKPTSSVLVFNPLFAKGIPAATMAERRMTLQGFTVAVFNVEKLLFATLGKTRPIGLSFDLLDLSAPADRQLLHRWTPRLAGSGSWRAYLFPKAPVTMRTFSFCGRNWGVNFTPSQEYMTRNYPLAYWLVLPAGGLLSMFLGLYFNTLYAKRQELEEQVLKRTVELQSSEKNLRELNVHLEERVIDRTKQLEAAIEALSLAKERAEAASRAKSIFLANMSHEIRTPLNAVLGFSQIAMGDQALSPENRHNLQIVNRSGEQLLTLINDVIDMARIEAGRMSLEKTVFDLPALLAHVVGQFIPKATARKLQLINESGTMVQYVTGDEEKIRHILSNLVDNALKFTDAGVVSLRSRTSFRDGQDWLEVEVEDSGRGIASGDMERIFAAFEQAKGGQMHQRGTGLGLTLCREYARLMGGDLTVTSELGQGSCFHLAIPVIKATEAPGPQPLELPPRIMEGETNVTVTAPAELAHELAQLPQELCDRLIAAARGLDKTSLLELIMPFAERAPGVAERLRTLADTYRFDLIEELVGQKLTASKLNGEHHG